MEVYSVVDKGNRLSQDWKKIVTGCFVLVWENLLWSAYTILIYHYP